MTNRERDLDKREHIDRLADLFEMDCREKRSPRIEDYLCKVTSDWRESLFIELFEIELELAAEIGQALHAKEYMKRFPEYGPIVNSKLADDDATVGYEVASADAERSSIDRYEIRQKLGSGAFGVVYEAYDPQLERLVALKIPHTNVWNSDLLRLAKDEAAAVARLDHPGIVQVFDCKQTEDFFLIVQQYVPGPSLASLLKNEQLTPIESAEMLLKISKAVAYAHRCNIVHRDLKPENILVAPDREPLVADFGLALREEFQHRQRGQRAGSPAYMSPEQVQALTHWLDGRTDIWSLGVMFYEMLTGRRPFRGRQLDQLFEEIRERDPKPPRMIRANIPGELQRICLKCLEKKLRDRYSTADDLAEDLHLFLMQNKLPAEDGAAASPLGPPNSAGLLSDEVPIQNEERSVTPGVISRGLRAFREEDAGFFLELLEGPRNREGLPESVAFWKTRIEPDTTTEKPPIGVIYGPSGCGKSSFVRAGLIPVLSERVDAIFVAAKGPDLAGDILNAVRKCVTGTNSEWDLSRTLYELRNAPDPSAKTLIVVDQVEQWLHTEFREDPSAVVEALKHCDGHNVQVLLLVRSDFWMSLTRLATALETQLVEGENIAAIDLFSTRHARRVMMRLGMSFGAIDEAGPSEEQQEFMAKSVDLLAEDHLVVCVRLVLFLEMIKAEPWLLDNLRSAEQTDQLGVQFLESTFNGPNAGPTRRLHKQAAQAALSVLLPDSNSELKGRGKSLAELQEATGYRDEGSMQELIRVLDSELRLITPVDMGDSLEDHSKKSYALTHDYLVTHLRQWLTLKESESASGRARLALSSRAAQWKYARQTRNLPSLAEYVRIRCLTQPKRWSDLQAGMMQHADRYYGVRTLFAVIAFFTASFVGSQVYSVVRTERARLAVQRAITVPAQAFPTVQPTVISYRQSAVPFLRNIVDTHGSLTRERTRANLLLISLTQDDQPSVMQLLDEIDEIELPELANIVEVLQPNREMVLEEVKQRLPNLNDVSASRIAYICLALGEFDWAADLIATSARQTLLMKLFDEWPAGIPAALKAFNELDLSQFSLRQEPVRLVIYAIGFHRNEVPESDQQKLISQLTDLFESKKTTASCHSVALWCLRQFGESPTSAAEYRSGVGWREVGDGLTLVEIPAGEIERFGETLQVDSFLCSNSEVSQQLFELFEKETQITRETDRISSSHTKLLPPDPKRIKRSPEVQELSPPFGQGKTSKTSNAASEEKPSIDGDLMEPEQAPLPDLDPPFPSSDTPFEQAAKEGLNVTEADPPKERTPAYESDPFSFDLQEFGETRRNISPMDYGYQPRGTIENRAGSVPYPLCLAFCNWLSARHGLTPAYRHEEKELGNVHAEGGAIEWSLNTTADGYRLPTSSEHTLFKSNRGFPDLSKGSPQVNGRFANLFEIRNNVVAPDSWGLFDVLGSYWEWCEPVQNSVTFENAPKLLMGGSWRSATLHDAYQQRLVRPAESSFGDFGFRVVRSKSASYDEGQWRKVYSSNPIWQNAILMAEAEENNSQFTRERIDNELEGLRTVVRFALDEGNFSTARIKLVEALQQIVPDDRLQSQVLLVLGNSSAKADEVASAIFWQSLELALKEHYATLEERRIYLDRLESSSGELDKLLDDLLTTETRLAECYRRAVEATFTLLLLHSPSEGEATKPLMEAIRGYLKMRQTRAVYSSALDLWQVADTRAKVNVETEIRARAGVRAARREFLLAEYEYQLAMKYLFAEETSK